MNKIVFIYNQQEYLHFLRILINKNSGLVMMILMFFNTSFADSIDFGLFESDSNSDQIDVKIKPDFDISENQTITAILYTIRWDNPEIEIDIQYLYPFFISPQGDPIESNGYYYQTFAAVPLTAQAMNENEEYIISSFSYINAACSSFEIIEDDWTLANNGNVYCELLGEDVTGFIYNPIIEFGSAGGVLSAGASIYLGQSTGLLSLSEHNGFVNNWQKMLNEGDWIVIPFSEGITNYSEYPSDTGTWFYRCEVQYDTCSIAYSETSQVVVMDTLTGVLTSFESLTNKTNIYYDGDKIQFNDLNKGGKLVVYNLIGQVIFEDDMITQTNFEIKINYIGILIYSYINRSTGNFNTGKIWVN